MTGTPAPVFTETFVTTDDGCRLWTARSEPSGSTSGTSMSAGFILCHGGPGFWDTLAPVAVPLADHGPVIRWDQRGGGRSIRDRTRWPASSPIWTRCAPRTAWNASPSSATHGARTWLCTTR